MTIDTKEFRDLLDAYRRAGLSTLRVPFDALIAHIDAQLARQGQGEPIGQVVMTPSYSTYVKWAEGVTPPSGTLLYTAPQEQPARAEVLEEVARLRKVAVDAVAALNAAMCPATARHLDESIAAVERALATQPASPTQAAPTCGNSHQSPFEPQPTSELGLGKLVLETAQAAPRVSEQDERAPYRWRSIDGKQHDTGRVTTAKGNYFATTGSPEDAKLIVEALNARAAQGAQAAQGGGVQIETCEFCDGSGWANAGCIDSCSLCGGSGGVPAVDGVSVVGIMALVEQAKKLPSLSSVDPIPLTPIQIVFIAGKLAQSLAAHPAPSAAAAQAKLLKLASDEIADACALRQEGDEHAEPPEWANLVVTLFASSAPSQAAQTDDPIGDFQADARQAKLDEAVRGWSAAQVAHGEPVALPRIFGVSRDAESPGGKGVLVSFHRALTDGELRAFQHVLGTLAAPVAPSQPEQAGEEPEAPSAKQERLRALADRIDHEKLWKLPLMYRDRLTDEQRDRLDAGVYLRRYADLLAPGRWLVLPPTGNVQFSAGSLDKVTEMAKRDEDRRAAHQASAQAGEGSGDAN